MYAALGGTCYKGKKPDAQGAFTIDCKPTEREKIMSEAINTVLDASKNVTNWAERVENSFSLWDYLFAYPRVESLL